MLNKWHMLYVGQCALQRCQDCCASPVGLMLQQNACKAVLNVVSPFCTGDEHSCWIYCGCLHWPVAEPWLI